MEMKPGNDDSLYRTEATFNSIYVIESLPPGDKKTGEDLFDAIIYPTAIQLGVEARFERVQSEQDLIAVLRLILSATSQANHRPIIHLESHGNQTGIQLGDGTIVEWRTVIPLLQRINLACENSLIVVAMACRGWYLTDALLPSERAPVFMLVGPPENVSSDAVLKATRRFYSALLADLDINSGLSAMNDQRAYSEWSWKPATAEILFCRTFRRYVVRCQEFCRSADFSARALCTFVGIEEVNLVEAELLRLEIVNVAKSPRNAYRHLHRRFLMLDLFPSRRIHFGLTFDLCFANAA